MVGSWECIECELQDKEMPEVSNLTSSPCPFTWSVVPTFLPKCSQKPQLPPYQPFHPRGKDLSVPRLWEDGQTRHKTWVNYTLILTPKAPHSRKLFNLT